MGEWNVPANDLLDTHCRIRASWPLVSVVTGRFRREARCVIANWAQERGSHTKVVARPSKKSALAIRSETSEGTKKWVYLFLGDNLVSTWEEAQAFACEVPSIHVAIATRVLDVAEVLTNPKISTSIIAGFIRGLVTIDPIESIMLDKVLKGQRLSPTLRSAYEGLLYYVLESRPETRDLFLTNKNLRGDSGRNYEVDLVSEAHRLIIEIDGQQHDRPKQIKSDVDKQKDLEKAQYRVLRYPASAVAARPIKIWEDVMANI